MNTTEPRTSNAPSATLMVRAGALVLAGIVLLATFLATTRDETESQSASHSPGVGRALEGLALEPLIGATKPVTLSEIRGKVVLLNIWGPWCTFCHVDLPRLVKLKNQWEDRENFQFVSVACNREKEDAKQLRSETEDYLQKRGFDFVVHWDPQARTRMALIDIAQLQDAGLDYPATLVLGKDGIIRGIWLGKHATGTEKEMADLVNKLLRES